MRISKSDKKNKATKVKRDPNLAYTFGMECFENKQYVAAVLWLKRAAMREHPDATYQLGVCYECDLGVPKDRMQAIWLYQRAAGLGCEAAHIRLQDFLQT